MQSHGSPPSSASPDCKLQLMRRAGDMPHAATNVASAAHVLARRVELLSPTSSEAASRPN